MSCKYPASDEFITWAESLSGMLTSLTTKYGAGSALVEHNAWDQNQTLYFHQMIHSISQKLNEIDEELSDHV